MQQFDLKLTASKSFWWYTDTDEKWHLCHCHSMPGAPGIALCNFGVQGAIPLVRTT